MILLSSIETFGLINSANISIDKSITGRFRKIANAILPAYLKYLFDKYMYLENLMRNNPTNPSSQTINKCLDHLQIYLHQIIAYYNLIQELEKLKFGKGSNWEEHLIKFNYISFKFFRSKRLFLIVRNIRSYFLRFRLTLVRSL